MSGVVKPGTVTTVSLAANKVAPVVTNTDGMKRRAADIKNKAVASTTGCIFSSTL
jgi:hypothetical protein